MLQHLQNTAQGFGNTEIYKKKSSQIRIIHFCLSLLLINFQPIKNIISLSVY